MKKILDNLYRAQHSVEENEKADSQRDRQSRQAVGRSLGLVVLGCKPTKLQNSKELQQDMELGTRGRTPWLITLPAPQRT